MNTIFKSILLILSLFSLKAYSNADITSTIENLYVYTEYGNGDVAFTTKDKGSTCYGYWFSGDSVGFDQVYGALLSAFHSKIPVQLSVNPGQSSRWAASSNHYCLIVRVALSNS